MSRGAHCRQSVEEFLEDADLAQPVEALPNAVPDAKALRQSPPCDVVNRKILQRLKKQPVIAALGAAARQTHPEHRHRIHKIVFAHLRGHSSASRSTGCL
jgi:hypothetical protein